jgi:signal transduction protein with GAF and PtsI domain
MQFAPDGTFPDNAIRVLAIPLTLRDSGIGRLGGGMVTHLGVCEFGPLSHWAVTAREMALPAVMSVRDVMTKLHEGQIVTVDGTQGVVRLNC